MRNASIFFGSTTRSTSHADEQSANECAARTQEELGGLDILVNNAALYYGIDNERNDYEYLQKVFSVNLHGAWIMSRACAPTMVEQRWGRIINQSSGAAYLYNIAPVAEFKEVGAFTYSQTKWGVIGLTKFLAAQLGQYNVTVNCIAPGVLDEGVRANLPEHRLGEYLRHCALGRKGTVQECAELVAMLASDRNSYMNGATVVLDGGV